MPESSTARPRITFGMIVLNGEPFLRYNLRALYPFAHEIIVVEGAVTGAAAIATDDGHSTDATLQTLQRFKKDEDPENKVKIITRDGFWSEKDEQSHAYAALATGDYLWQVDVDEFYQPVDMASIIDLLVSEPDITTVSFPQITFWGGFDYLTDGWYLRLVGNTVHRIFRWGQNYSYGGHRPPTVYDGRGRDLRELVWIPANELESRGIRIYHYSLLFPRQVLEKSLYYDAASWAQHNEMAEWAEGTYLGLKRPYHVHNVYHYMSWLERYSGQHPPQIEAMRADIASGRLNVETRPTGDIERLLRSRQYSLGRAGLKMLTPLVSCSLWIRNKMKGQSRKQI
ncbi:MAG: glycosyltransferase family 2 protein [Candidatus Promineifilaceae bacterium]